MSRWCNLCVHELNLMVGHQCPMIHWFLHKAYASRRQSKQRWDYLGIMYTLWCLKLVLFRSLVTTKPITKEAPIYLRYWCHAIRFKCFAMPNPHAICYCHNNFCVCIYITLVDNSQVDALAARVGTWPNLPWLLWKDKKNIEECHTILKLKQLVCAIPNQSHSHFPYSLGAT